MTKDEYVKRLEEILLTYGGYCSQQIEATDGDKQFFEAITAIQQLNNEAIGKNAKIRYDDWKVNVALGEATNKLRQELRNILGESNE